MGPSETFGSFVFLSIVPMMALVVLMDRVSGLSFRLASLLGRKRPDGVLLILTLLVAVAAWIVFTAIAIPYVMVDGVIGVPSYHKPEFEAAVAAMNASKRLVTLYLYIDAAVILLSVIASVWLVLRQKRSAILWFLMGIFGNVGSIVWLIAARRKAAPLARA